ncbi:hypothetical protein HID58_070015 [Brassica napus]|uniref:Uncharacterized protein n=1 Tax=Brassica napus TaxID=3708 RepID=A0ABQ7YXN0_BRANA|nr:hypothetical protein HID58_070015 [Brassica napus]
MLRRVRPSSSPSTMTVLPLGKIEYVWFWCEYGSCSSLFWPLFVRSMGVKGPEHDHQTIPAMNLPFDDPLTILCSRRTPLASVHPDDHKDQRLSFGSGKSPWFHHGNGEVLRLWLESMLVPSEIGVKGILLSTGVEESSPLMSDLFLGMTLSALPWGEHGIISESYAHVVKLQRPLHTRLAIFGICLMGNSESSHSSGSIYANSFWPDLSMFICGPKLATSTSRNCSGRERSSSTSSFSKERLIPPISLFARLGPVGETTLIQMRVKVLDGVATSHTIVTNRLLFEDFEMRCKSFID